MHCWVAQGESDRRTGLLTWPGYVGRAAGAAAEAVADFKTFALQPVYST